jgi:hypothetical protein
MMRDIIRQAAVILSILITLVVNTLANTLPINGMNTGQISDQFQVYFVPAGYVFSIWGLIYLGLIAYGIFQALPSQRTNPRLQRIGWWVVLSGLANSTWIFLWHYEQFAMSVIVMLILLAALILVFLKLQNGRSDASLLETWAVHVPFSIYLGWITVATVANITSLLDYWNWDGFGLAPEIWMGIMLAAVLAITSTMIYRHQNVPYTLVILWALIGIAVKFSQTSTVAIPTWITFGLILVVLVFVLLQQSDIRKLSAKSNP